MIERRHFGQGVATLVRVIGLCLLSLTVAGCRHKKTMVLPQVSLAPIDLEVLPQPEDPPMIAAAQAPETVSLPSKAVEQPRRVTRRRPAPAKEPPPPVQVASAPEPATIAIGSLSSGGDSTPQIQQQAREMITAITKRLDALSGKVASQQKDLLRQVRSFLKQAQQALDASDADGAKNLATKAKLLMDDAEKK